MRGGHLPLLAGGAGAGGGFAQYPSGDYPAGITPWAIYDARNLAAALANNDPVPSWPDAGPDGRDAAEASSTLQPRFLTGVINGEPVVDFDGTEHLGHADCSLVNGDDTLFTAIVVGIVDSITSSGQAFFGFGSTSSDNPLVVMRGLDSSGDKLSTIRRGDAGGGVQSVNLGALVEGTAYVMTSILFAGGATIIIHRLDNVEVGGGGVPGQGVLTCNNFKLGALHRTGKSNWLDGKLAFVGLYEGALSSADANDIEDELNTIWAVY